MLAGAPLQVGPFPAPMSGPAVFGAIASFVGTLLIGGLLVLAWPRYVDGRVEELAANPVASVAYGVATLGGLFAVSWALTLTGIGAIVALPLLLAFLVLSLAGGAIGYLAIADRFVDGGIGWGVPLLVAAVVNAGLSLTGIGALFGYVVVAAGAGPIVHATLE